MCIRDRLEYCKNTNGVKHIKTMRTRKHGAFAYVDLVICVDGNLTVIQGLSLIHI